MKRLTLILLMAVILPLVVSCTHNNGDIGTIFGLWKIVSVDYSSDTDKSDYEGNIFWAFQSTTIKEIKVLESNETKDVYGNYRLYDNTLFLDFPDDIYEPLSDLGLPRQCELQVIKMTGNEMVFEYQPEDENTITYTLKKW